MARYQPCIIIINIIIIITFVSILDLYFYINPNIDWLIILVI